MWDWTLVASIIIRTKPERWVRGYLISIGGSKNNPEKNYFKQNSFPLFDVNKEFLRLVPKFLNYGIKRQIPPQEILEDILLKQVTTIKKNLQVITKAISHTDFNNIFSSHISISNIQINDLNGLPPEVQLLLILKYYECVALMEDGLEDIPTRHERNKLFSSKFQNEIKLNLQYPIKPLEKITKASLNLKKQTLAKAIQNYESKMNLLAPLSQAAYKAAGAYSDYCEHMYELYSGK